MLFLALIILSVWTLASMGVVVLCVAVRHADEENAGEPKVLVPRAAARVPARAFSRVVPR